MTIDIRTLIFILGLTHLLQIAVFLQQNAENRRVRGPGWWLLWSAAEVAGFACLFLRGFTALHFPAIIAQNLFLIGGVVFLYIGLLRFLGKKENKALIYSGLAVYLAGFLYFLFIKNDIDARGAFISAALAAVALESARALLAARKRALSASVKFLAAGLAIHGVFHLWRAVQLLAFGSGPDIFAPTALNISTYLDAILAGLAWTFGLVLLVSQRLSAEAREAIEELELFFDTSPDAVVVSGLKNGLIDRVSSGFTAITGYASREVEGKTTRDINLWMNPEDRVRFTEELLAKGAVSDFETCFRRKDGGWLTGLVSARVIDLKDAPHIISVTRDITGRKREAAERAELEEKLRQSQKIETVGRLAGGIAHDFNNLLTAINGNAGFLLKELPDDHMRAEVIEILAAAARASKLTTQLLAFSRKQILKPQIIDLNGSVGGVVKMLSRLIGENIRIETKLEERACRVLVDPGQIDQVIINLAVNARDAMRNGGTLTLETSFVAPTGLFLWSNLNLPPGPLACLLVRDTGCGFTAEAREHLFEPFFTTKEVGKGTGMGLSTVQGIVKQSGGEIELESSQAGGTTFRIYFPHVEAAIPDPEPDKDKAADTPTRGGETVLLAEDEESLRRLVERLLRQNGYTVIAAADGKSALEAAERHGKPVDLLLTDVIMPVMGGRELALEMARRKLAGRTLYMSGYTDDAIADHGVLSPGVAFIYKPYTVESLIEKLRGVLSGPADQARA